MDRTHDTVTTREKLGAIWDVIRYDPRFTLLIIGLGVVAAAMQGIGLSFIFPIIENVQSPEPITDSDGALGVFVDIYTFFDIPFTLGYVVLGAMVVLTFRYATSFLFGWLQQMLRSYYIRDLQERMFDTTLAVSPADYDEFQSDQVLNDIITETYYAGRVIQRFTSFFEVLLLTLVYLVIAMLISPAMTGIAFLFLALVGAGLAIGLESGYVLGNRVAEGNAQRHESAQTAVQNLRDVRLLGSETELRAAFQAGIDRFTTSRIQLRRNQNAIKYTYELAVAVSVLVLLYVGVTIVELPVSLLVLYLLVMTQIGPSLSSLHLKYYQILNDLPHLVWVQQFMDRVRVDDGGPDDRDPDGKGDVEPVTDPIDRIEFDDVTFTYDGGKRALEGVSLAVERSEAVAVVGPSGAGKSTLQSLLAGIYEPESGAVRVNGRPLGALDTEEWHDRIAFVRQDPPLFHETLESNLTVGNRDVSEEELDRVCELTCLDEVVADLPDGYDTVVGDDGTRLSSGQQQRVALARALLGDPDLVLLDEATSKLDERLEREILTSITDRDVMIVSVAPRAPPDGSFDRIRRLSDLERAGSAQRHDGSQLTGAATDSPSKYKLDTDKLGAMSEEGADRDELTRRTILKSAAAGAAVAGGIGQFPGIATAQEGEKLGEISFPSTGDSGVSNTFTGEFLIVVDGFTTNEVDIYEPSPEENADATHVATKFLPVQISGVTWDHTRGRLWATEGSDGQFYLIDLGDQTESGEIDDSDVETRFTLSEQGWPADGLAYDGGRDSVWWTPDGSDGITEVDTDGTVVTQIVPERNENGDPFIHHSGVAVGQELDDRPTLYLGDNAEEAGQSENSVVRVFADTGEHVTTYADVPFRVEDIACDPVTYAPQEAIVVKDAFDSKSTTFRVEDGTCPVAAGGPNYTVLRDALDEFEAAYKYLLEASFRGQGHHEAVLYHRFGEEYAERVTNFWGYKAGELSDDDVRDSARELGDATLEMAREEADFEYEQNDAEILYQFYQELFAELAGASDLAERKEIGAAYYLGEHDGQEASLTFDDGMTVSEGFAEDWEFRTEVVDELTGDGDLTQDQVQRAATGLSERAGKLRTRGDRLIESMARAAEELEHHFDENRTEVQARILGGDAESRGDDVGPQAVITGTTLLIGTAVAGLASFAGGYLLTKCGTAGTAAQAEGVEFEWVDLSVTPEDNPALSSWMTGVSLGQIIQQTGEPVGSESQDEVDPDSAIGAFLKANFIAGSQTAGKDLAVTGGELLAQSGFAKFAEGEITTLELPDIEDETQLDRLDTFINSVKSFLEGLPVIGDWFDFGAPTNGEATGTLEIENAGAVPFRPTFELDYSLRNERGKFGSGFKAEVEGSRDVLAPEDSPREYDVTYQVPTDEGFLSGELDVSLGMTPEAIVPTPDAIVPVSVCELDYNAVGADSTRDRFNVSEEVTVERIDDGAIPEGDVQTTTIAPDSETEQVTVELDFEGYTSDLHLYDEAGNHVGYDYEAETIENEISGASHSGRDTGETNNEWISFPPTGETYTVEVRAPSIGGSVSSAAADSTYTEADGDAASEATVRPTDALTSEFDVSKLEKPELSPKLGTTPSTLAPAVGPEADTATFSVVVREVNGDQAAESVSLSATSLEHGDGTVIPAGNVTFSEQDFDVAGSQRVEVTVELPDEPSLGVYPGEVEVAAGNTDPVVVPAELEIGEQPDGPPPLPGQDNPPQDLTGDGLYRDVDGDGRFTIGDVQVFFQNRDSDVVQNNPAAFNFDGKEPAEVTIGDVQALFDDFVESDLAEEE